MRKINILLSLLLIILFSSCDKEQDLNIKMTNINSGNLIVQVVDNSGNPIANARIKINNGLFDEFTDEQGQYNFGKLLSGTYYIEIEDVVVNGREYFPEKTIQIIAGEDKTVLINVEEYVGTMIFTVYTYLGYPVYDDTTVANVTIALIPYEDFEWGMDFDELLDISTHSQTTNSEGVATFSDVPSNYVYYQLVYIDSENYQIITYGYSVDRKDEREIDLDVDEYIFGILFE